MYILNTLYLLHSLNTYHMPKFSMQIKHLRGEIKSLFVFTASANKQIHCQLHAPWSIAISGCRQLCLHTTVTDFSMPLFQLGNNRNFHICPSADKINS